MFVEFDMDNAALQENEDEAAEILEIREGWHGVFVHSSFPNAGPSGAAYRTEDAVSLHTREADAQRVIDADTTGTLVTRWVTA